MKKLYIILFCLLFSLCSSCTKDDVTLEGYWLNENNEHLVFDAAGKVTSDDFSGSYSIYDDNKVQISFSLFFIETHINASFEIKDEVLTLTNLDTGDIYIYYGNPRKQQEIRDAISEQLAQEQVLKQAAQDIADYNALIDELLSQVNRNNAEIDRLNDEKQRYLDAINSDNEQIAQIRRNILSLSSQIQAESDVAEVAYLEGELAYEKSNLVFYETEITYYENLIDECAVSIDKCNLALSDLKFKLAKYEYHQDLSEYSEATSTAIRKIQKRVLDELDNTYKYRKLLYIENGNEIISGDHCVLIQVCFDMGTHTSTIGHFAVSTSTSSIYELNFSTGEYELTPY